MEFIFWKNYTFKCKLTSKIIDMVKMLAKKENFPIENILLKYNGKQLDHFLSLEYYDIKEESIIEATFYSYSGFTLFISTLEIKLNQFLWNQIIKLKILKKF